MTDEIDRTMRMLDRIRILEEKVEVLEDQVDKMRRFVPRELDPVTQPTMLYHPLGDV